MMERLVANASAVSPSSPESSSASGKIACNSRRDANAVSKNRRGSNASGLPRERHAALLRPESPHGWLLSKRGPWEGGTPF